jgi:hypothetical protein
MLIRKQARHCQQREFGWCGQVGVSGTKTTLPLPTKFRQTILYIRAEIKTFSVLSAKKPTLFYHA